MERRHITLQDKLDIIEYARANTKKQASRMYNVQTKQIRDWESKEQEIREVPENERKKKFTLHKGPEVLCEEAERLLSDWHNEMVVIRGLGVTIGALMTKLKEFTSLYNEMNETALRSKIHRFMERHNLVLRRVTSYQTVAQDALQPIIDTFSQEVQSFLDDERMDFSQVYNMDQTAIFFDMPPSYTVVERGVRRNRIQLNGNNYKKRVTVILLVRSDGQKYKPLIVFKAVPGARIAHEIEEYDDDEVHHTVQENAWTDEEVLKTWNEEIWSPIIERNPGNKLLFLDSLKLHKQNEKLLKNNNREVNVKYIPEYCTPLLQPLDIGVIKVFKKNFRRIWSNNPDVEITRAILSTWIKQAWREVPEEAISKSFRQYLVQEGEMQRNDSRMEIE